jgi:hypothetical protein
MIGAILVGVGAFFAALLVLALITGYYRAGKDPADVSD